MATTVGVTVAVNVTTWPEAGDNGGTVRLTLSGGVLQTNPLASNPVTNSPAGQFNPARLAESPAGPCVPDQPLLPGFEELFAPAVIQIWIQAFAATERDNALLAPQAPLEDNPDLLFDREPTPGLPPDVLNDLLC